MGDIEERKTPPHGIVYARMCFTIFLILYCGIKYVKSLKRIISEGFFITQNEYLSF